MRQRTPLWMTAFTAFALMACGSDGSTDPDGGGGNGGGGDGGGDPDPSTEPAAVAIVSGDAQDLGTLREGSPLVVEVTDADGEAVSDVSVTWSVTDGPGSISPTSVPTDADGRASATFTAGTSLGTSSVEATVGEIGESVTFSIETSTIVIRMQGLAFIVPGGGDQITVPVGTRIEWENLDSVQHTATSSAEPPGGAEISSGFMNNGDTYSFTPMVEGTWEYFCQVHPSTMVGATITATSN